jgi:broad specificity polyphosphatase/5'/3'-nucleotidase SurE
MRVLDRSVVSLDLDNLGLLPAVKERLRQYTDLPHGIMLVTGPTGAGKSTSLYAFLSSINSVTKRIITVEEPVEYELKGINQIAVSLERSPGRYDFGPSALVAAQVAERMLAGTSLPPRTFLNLNVPSGRPKGIRVTVQARRNHVTVVDERVDPRGQAYYWIEEGQNDWEPHDRSDYQAVRDGFVSLTPLKPDLTDYNALALLDELSAWREVEVE